MKTGDTAYIKEKLKIMCQNLPGIEKEYKNHLWYLQDLVKKGSFRCTFDFDVKDTPVTNKQLMYLNSKYVQAFGKKMSW